MRTTFRDLGSHGNSWPISIYYSVFKLTCIAFRYSRFPKCSSCGTFIITSQVQRPIHGYTKSILKSHADNCNTSAHSHQRASSYLGTTNLSICGQNQWHSHINTYEL